MGAGLKMAASAEVAMILIITVTCTGTSDEAKFRIEWAARLRIEQPAFFERLGGDKDRILFSHNLWKLFGAQRSSESTGMTERSP